MRVQSATSLKLWFSVMAFALASLCPGLVNAESDSDTGTVTIEILPPGGLDRREPAPGVVYIPPGTLTAKILYLPDPDPGERIVDGVVVVEDHRQRSDGWTVHLGETSGNSGFLERVIVGAEGWGISGWIYEGVHVWDTAQGMSLEQAPPLITAQVGSGRGVTLSYTEIAIDPTMVGEEVDRGVLNLIIPAAP